MYLHHHFNNIIEFYYVQFNQLFRIFISNFSVFLQNLRYKSNHFAEISDLFNVLQSQILSCSTLIFVSSNG